MSSVDRSFSLGPILLAGLAATFVAVASPATVRAQNAGQPVDDERVTKPVARPSASQVVATGQFLADFQAARVSPVAGSGLGLAGFDGARHTAVFSATAEVGLTRWLALRGDAIYRPSDRPSTTDSRSVARPAVSLRARVLQQSLSGVDLAVVAGYSQDKLAAEGGMLHLGAAIGRSFDRLSLIGNLSLGGDPEGDDRDGTLGGAALWRVVPSLHVGAQGFFRRDLASTDPRHLQRKDGQHDYAIGPVASYTHDVLVFTVQTGVSEVAGAGTSTVGLLALGGVGAIF